MSPQSGDSRRDLLVERIHRLEQETQALQSLINDKRRESSEQTVAELSREAQKATPDSLLAADPGGTPDPYVCVLAVGGKSPVGAPLGLITPKLCASVWLACSATGGSRRRISDCAPEPRGPWRCETGRTARPRQINLYLRRSRSSRKT